LEAARRLGVHAIRALDVPPAHTTVTDHLLGLDFRDPARSTRLVQAYAREHPLRAVVATDDATVVLAARLAESLGLPHNSPASAEAARDKHLMRQRFARAGVPSPWFELLTVGDDPHQVASRLAYPCVLKPTHLSGSRGVIRANHADEFVAAWARLTRMLSHLGSSEVLVEGYIPGDEFALEGLLTGGQLTVLALFDKPDPMEGPFFEETIYVTPSRFPHATQAAIAACAQAAASALGLRAGPVHAELRFNADGPWMLELAGRSIGGLCSQTLRFVGSAEMSLEELILRHMLGMDLEGACGQRDRQAGGVMMIPIPGAGVLTDVGGLEAARAVPGIESIEITARLNYPLTPLPEGESYLGFIFARGETPAEVERALRVAHRELRFDILPELPLT
jgi:formate-dependent phosphoribosylglycinamide formyltransferase (GAR transformylase)